MSMALSYTLISARSTFRNGRYVVFTLALPLVLYLMFNSLYGNDTTDTGINVAAYLMVSMAAYGAMGATITAGARIAIERQVGWNRQLRLTALSPQGYMVAKAAVAMLVAIPAIVLVFAAGAVVGHAQMSTGQWFESGIALWLGLIPYSVLGMIIGFVASIDAAQPLTMIVYLGLSILGGLWFPVEQFPTFMQHVAKALPSYWTAEIARAPLTHSAIPLTGVLVLAAWTIGLTVVGMAAYRRSGARV
jgi:ABC-2 type transport system permease protein